MSKPFAAFVIFTAAFTALHAATVTTELSADEVPVGAVVQMQVRVEGSTNVTLPQDLGVDGLQSALTGRGTQISIINGRMTASGTYSYTIRPMREGTFEIPALELNVDGRKQKTTPQRLVVTAGGTSNPPAYVPVPGMPPAPTPQGNATSRTSPDDARGRRVFAKLIIPKKTIYVGEVVPVEVQLFLSTPFKPERDLQLAGEGFTAQKIEGEPAHSIEAVGNTRYDVYTFKSSITAVKSGALKTPVASIPGMVSVPLDEGNGGQDSLFGSFLGLMQNQRVTIESESEPIQVKPLPTQGRPADFSGAVGDFTITASAKPEKVAAGDPVTLTVEISGRGNFDAMGDPELVDEDGWRPYPATSRFEKTDDIGYGGRKIFETPLVAQKPQTHTPVAQFSYFDPDKGKYFTIKTQPVPVEAAASQAPEPSATVSSAAKPSATPAPEESRGQWLTHARQRSWQPVLKWPVFWVLNGAAALVLVALLGVGLVRRRREGPAGKRAAMARRRDRLVAELAQAGHSDEVFCAKALEALSLQAELAGSGGPFEFVRSLETRGAAGDLQRVLARGDEIKFSGGSLASPLGAAERESITKAIREVCR